MTHFVQSGIDCTPELKPLTLGPSLLYFGLPALLFVAGFWAVMLWLIGLGMLPYYAYLLGVGSPLAVLLAAALLWLTLEGRAVNWETIKARLRLHPKLRYRLLTHRGVNLRNIKLSLRPLRPLRFIPPSFREVRDSPFSILLPRRRL